MNKPPLSIGMWHASQPLKKIKNLEDWRGIARPDLRRCKIDSKIRQDILPDLLQSLRVTISSNVITCQSLYEAPTHQAKVIVSGGSGMVHEMVIC